MTMCFASNIVMMAACVALALAAMPLARVVWWVLDRVAPPIDEELGFIGRGAAESARLDYVLRQRRPNPYPRGTAEAQTWAQHYASEWALMEQRA